MAVWLSRTPRAERAGARRPGYAATGAMADRSASSAACSATAVSAAGSPEDPKTPARRKRGQLPRIDFDATIEEAKAALKRATKAMTEARALAKNERRKKARLLKKAAALSPEDLERIAVLKRCGLWNPLVGEPGDCQGNAAGAADKAPAATSAAQLSAGSLPSASSSSTAAGGAAAAGMGEAGGAAPPSPMTGGAAAAAEAADPSECDSRGDE